MSSPYDQNPGQPQYGQPPQFGAPVPQQPGQPGQPQQPQQPMQPQFGQPTQQAAPAWGTAPTAQYPDPNQNPYAAGNPYQQPYAGVPTQPGKPPKQRGRGAAGFFAVLFGTIFGRVALGLVVAGGFALYHYATSDNAQRNSTGQVTQAGSVAATDLAVGDCFDSPTGTSGISSVKAIPCTQAHDSQVYAEPKISETSFPGASTLETEAKNDCESDTTESAVSSDVPSTVGPEEFFPQDDTTFEQQNYFICAIAADSATLTQSYVGTASAAS
ncbi:MAG TPA: hypothetical protein VFN97_28845 [Actinospica sp.]|nr:hypothetical protein [Actinospica sp.]